MKLGILYTVGGSMALIAAVGLVTLAIIPFEGTASHIVTIVGRVIFALFLGFYMLPRGLLRIRKARYSKEVKHESQTS